ncbi:MAG TPA: PHP domain-containing protein [Polyangiaceae bacterium]
MQDARQVSLGLDELAALYEFLGASRFKALAYRRAAEIVNTLGGELGPLIEQKRLEELEGIGSATARQIEEIWNSGGSELLTKLRGEAPPGVSELVQVKGLTTRRIRALSEALGIRSVAELRAACAEGRVRPLKGFGDKTEARLLANCDAWLKRDETPEPLLLAAALELSALVQKRLLEVAERAEPAGALRRGDETLRELEFVVVGDLERALAHLTTLRQVLRVDAGKRLAYLTRGVTLTLRGADAEGAGTALFRATGTAEHVDGVERRALSRGVSLQDTAFSSEEALYGAAGLAVVPPELRAGAGVLDEAAQGDFRDLLDASDVLGMVHCHTTYSDGKNDIREMALAAHALGMQYITITDHSPSAHYARGVTLDRLKEQWDEIAQVQEEVPIRILRGTESDILADGSLDFPDSVLERFDVLIASIHSRHRMDRAAMTSRITRALSLPFFKIWGHALGRILNHREPIDCDVPAILDALAGSRGAVEVNADPHRLDLPPAWMAAVRERKIPFVISVDAHSTRGLGVLRYGVTMARRGGVRKHEVLNAAPADAFAAAVRPV